MLSVAVAKYLIRVTICLSMGSHVMKTTVVIADDLFKRTQRLARKQKTTFRALTEAGLRLVIAQEHSVRSKKLSPLVPFGHKGPTEDFQEWNWEKIRDEIYKGRGA
jgi:hypothetical protein